MAASKTLKKPVVKPPRKSVSAPRAQLQPRPAALGKTPPRPAALGKAPPRAASLAVRPSKKRGPDPERVAEVYRKLRERHSDAHCDLDHRNPFELILATVLSAQSTDVMVNKITPDLFARWPTPEALAGAPPAEVEQALSRIGMFRQKAKNIVGLAKRLVAEHQGQVPRTLEQLIALPGVGRKTANVVLGVAFGIPEGVVVDTHVQRVSQRLGWTKHSEPPEIERDLMALFPRAEWDMLAHVLIYHGRRVCAAQRPACAACPVNTECPSAFAAENVGRKKPKLRVGSKTVVSRKNP